LCSFVCLRGCLFETCGGDPRGDIQVQSSAKREIDRLMAEFFGAVSFEADAEPLSNRAWIPKV
jgi:hypothetical protein